MLRANSYDTICHEHLTYFTLQTVRAILEQVGMHMVDVEFNDVNGGSFAVTARKDRPSWHTTSPDTQNQRSAEEASPQHLLAFRLRALHHRAELIGLIHELHVQGARVGALGASTKGNVLLQFCDFGPDDIEAIGEINPQKIGRVTPGSNIPIVSEAEVLENCTHLLVLPWHFRASFENLHARYPDKRFIYPLPAIEVV